MNNGVQELLNAYIAVDKVRRETNGNWSPQWEIHNKLNDLGFYIERDVSGESPRFRIEKRQGYWGNSKRWQGDVVVG